MDFPRVGAEFAGYRLESVIARGGMSTVFLSESLRLARKVAVKVLAQDLASKGQTVSWLAVDRDARTGKITEWPSRQTIPVAADEQLIVELYSK